MPSQIKGTAIQSYLEWLKSKVSAPQVAAILGLLSPSTRESALSALASTQYPYALYGEMLQASKAVLGEAYERLAFEHGRYAADVLLSSVYKTHVKPGDVGRTLQALARAWRIYFDTGQIEITDETPRHYVFAFEDATYHPLHPPISAGYVQRACEIAGADRAAVAIEGAPPKVKMTITWQGATPNTG